MHYDECLTYVWQNFQQRISEDFKINIFWAFLLLSDSYKWKQSIMFLSFQHNRFSELCDSRNAIWGFHESKNKCFQMTMSCLQKRKKTKRLQKSICSSMNPRERKKGKEFQAGCTHAYILLPWGTLQCRAAINIARMSPQNHPSYTMLSHSLGSIFGIHIVRWGGEGCLKRGVGQLKVGFRALWWPTAAEGEYQGDPKQACQGCYRNPLT